jgi:His-Xaa-Ser system radical SAM maturase HxsC
MLQLSGHALEGSSAAFGLFRLTTRSDLPTPLRSQRALLVRNDRTFPAGFAHYFTLNHESLPPEDINFTRLGEMFDYLSDDDIVHLSEEGRIRTLFCANSNHNALLLTEQCNNFCLMCSQPPKKQDDRWIIGQIRQLIPLISRDTKSLGITGGEPTLRRNDFIDIIRLCKSWLPNTALHILSNGRTFVDTSFCSEYASIRHPDLMIGIPLYSDDPSRHDYVVQAKGAFDETIRGIINLKRFSQKVEIRVVIHKQTFGRLPLLAEFIGRNLLFVDQVALMGLEITGFTKANLDSLWIDPVEYKDKLSDAVNILRSYRIPTLVYNHQLCTINPDTEFCYVKSISDWKNEYAPECAGCLRRGDCGGFFAWNVKQGHRQTLKPFAAS